MVEEPGGDRVIGARVNVVGNWGDEFARRVNRVTRDAVQDAVEVGAREASAAAQSRRRTGKMAQMEVLAVRGTPTGWQAGFRSEAWYAGFQSRGTKRGITPLKFLEQGRSAARKHLISRLNRL